MRKIVLLLLIILLCTVTVFAATDAQTDSFETIKTYIIGSCIFGFVVALIITLVMKSKLKSVRSQRTAANYQRPGSMQLTHSSDLFLYSTVTRMKKPEPSKSNRF